MTNSKMLKTIFCLLVVLVLTISLSACTPKEDTSEAVAVVQEIVEEPIEFMMPDLIGDMEAQAMDELKGINPEVKIELVYVYTKDFSKDTVAEQTLTAGEKTKLEEITLLISLGAPPEVVGMGKLEAIDKLYGLGFKIATENVVDTSVDAGTVVDGTFDGSENTALLKIAQPEKYGAFFTNIVYETSFEEKLTKVKMYIDVDETQQTNAHWSMFRFIDEDWQKFHGQPEIQEHRTDKDGIGYQFIVFDSEVESETCINVEGEWEPISELARYRPISMFENISEPKITIKEVRSDGFVLSLEGVDTSVQTFFTYDAGEPVEIELESSDVTYEYTMNFGPQVAFSLKTHYQLTDSLAYITTSETMNVWVKDGEDNNPSLDNIFINGEKYQE